MQTLARYQTDQNSRRKVLKGALALGILASPLGLLLSLGRGTAGNPAEAVILGSQQWTLQLGRAYCELNPGEANIGILRGLVGKAVDSDPGIPIELTEFHNGDTVSVNGWILARTEARRYALEFLTGSDHGI